MADVVDVVVKCALDVTCISPPGSGQHNQSVSLSASSKFFFCLGSSSADIFLFLASVEFSKNCCLTATTSRFDQSVFSAVLASKNYRCHNNWMFNAYLEQGE